MLSGTRVVPSLQEDWSDYKVHFSSELDLDIPDDMRRCGLIINHMCHLITSLKDLRAATLVNFVDYVGHEDHVVY